MHPIRARFALLALLCLVGCRSQPTVCATAPLIDPTRHAFRNLIDRPAVSLEPEIREEARVGDDINYQFTYQSDFSQRVTGVLIKPANLTGRLPVVIACHGTGGKKEDMVRFLRQLTAKGFIGVAIDGRYHGERAMPVTMPGLNSYQEAIVKSWRGSGEHPLYYDTVWDLVRLVDYLQTRDDVDASRIGCYGVSKGGIETYLFAFADPRVAVAVPTIGVQTFEWGLEHDDWKGRVGTFQPAFDAAVHDAGLSSADSAFTRKFYDKVMPAIDSQFDGPKVLPLIAPRPVLVVNSDNDPHTPIGGVRETLDAAKLAYDRAGASDHFSFIIQPGAGHRVLPTSEAAAVDWFLRWLNPADAISRPSTNRATDNR